MKKLWTTIALILGMMGILTACGSSQSSLSNRDEGVQRYAWPLATAQSGGYSDTALCGGFCGGSDPVK